jgi:hypothetical protein
MYVHKHTYLSRFYMELLRRGERERHEGRLPLSILEKNIFFQTITEQFSCICFCFSFFYHSHIWICLSYYDLTRLCSSFCCCWCCWCSLSILQTIQIERGVKKVFLRFALIWKVLQICFFTLCRFELFVWNRVENETKRWKIERSGKWNSFF